MILSGLTESTSAAICGRTVAAPWPISMPELMRKKVPSSFMRMIAAEPAFVGMEGDFQPAAMPFARIFVGLPEGSQGLSYSISSRTVSRHS